MDNTKDLEDRVKILEDRIKILTRLMKICCKTILVSGYEFENESELRGLLKHGRPCRDGRSVVAHGYEIEDQNDPTYQEFKKLCDTLFK